MGPTWVLSAPDGPHVGPMDPAIRVAYTFWLVISIHWGVNENDMKTTRMKTIGVEITESAGYLNIKISILTFNGNPNIQERRSLYRDAVQV